MSGLDLWWKKVSRPLNRISRVLRFPVRLWICVFYLGRGALTLYLYFLQVDTWEEVNLFNYLPLALYKSIFLFFWFLWGFHLFLVFYILYLNYNYPRHLKKT